MIRYLLLIDEKGNPLPLYYSAYTHIHPDADRTITDVSLDFDKNEYIWGDIEVYLMVDTYTVICQILTFDFIH